MHIPKAQVRLLSKTSVHESLSHGLLHYYFFYLPISASHAERLQSTEHSTAQHSNTTQFPERPRIMSFDLYVLQRLQSRPIHGCCMVLVLITKH